VRRIAVGGDGGRLRLAVLAEEGPERPWLLGLHGFTGSWRTWRPFARRFGAAFRLAFPDLPGHGASDAPADPAAYALAPTAERMAEALERLSPGRPAHVLGYSMGGRVALHLALARPDLVASIALEGASPGIEDVAERAARRRSDEALARLIEEKGIDAFVDHWQALPLFRGQAAMAAARRERVRRERLGQSPQGMAMSLRGAGAGSQEDLWPRLGALGMPVLFVAGGLDERYAAVGRRLVARVPDGRLARVAGAGHSAHVERPATFARALEAFWREIGVGPP
jgi:2-succinyl-6-hydroxy-2,4-cyclohexadiene-1-carboxylate synthase